MSGNIQSVDPWLKKGKGTARPPASSQLVCIYESHLVIDQYDEAVFLNRTPRQDELWTVAAHLLPDAARTNPDSYLNCTPEHLLGVGLAVTRASAGTDHESALEMLETLIRSRIGHSTPMGLVREGLVDQQAYDRLLISIGAEYEANVEAAKARESTIVAEARRLKLNPEPKGTNDVLWYANCPGRPHRMLLNAEKDEFFCGYCHKQGGIGELKAVVAKARRAG